MFEQITASLKPERVLEIGTIPTEPSLLLLPSVRGAMLRVGIDLGGPYEFDGVKVLRGNVRALPFRNGLFDLILCNSVLEHDSRFWLSLQELKRVAKIGADIFIGVPAFASTEKTLPIHNYPGDYYRFSEQAVREVFFSGGLELIQLWKVMSPPRIIGRGYRIDRKTAPGKNGRGVV